MKPAALSALAMLLSAGAARADPPGVVERIRAKGGMASQNGPTDPVYRVDLRGNGVADADLAGLCELHGLAVLALWDTQVSDEGLRAVAGLRQVKFLFLQGDYVTDAGLRHLEGMDGLNGLSIGACPHVTDEAVARLRKALPRC